MKWTLINLLLCGCVAKVLLHSRLLDLAVEVAYEIQSNISWTERYLCFFLMNSGLVQMQMPNVHHRLNYQPGLVYFYWLLGFRPIQACEFSAYQNVEPSVKGNKPAVWFACNGVQWIIREYCPRIKCVSFSMFMCSRSGCSSLQESALPETK